MRVPSVEWYRTFWLEHGGKAPKLMCGGEVITEVNFTHTDHYVYLGQEDPYCYIELTYDTWWLQSKGTKDHCIEEFHKKDCSYLGNRVLTSEIEFLEIKTVEDCIGIKGSRQEKRQGQPGWYRVLRSDPPVVTPHGILHVVAKEDGYYQLHEMYKWYSLYLDGKTYKNAALENGLRRWINPHWLLVTKEKSLSTLINSPVKCNLGWRYPLNLEQHTGNGLCSTALNIRGENFTYWPVAATSAVDWSDRVTLSCGKDICECPTITLEHLTTMQPEHLTSINRELIWYEKVIDLLIDMVWKVVGETFYLVMGQNWQGTLLLAGICYYIASVVTLVACLWGLF
ncbi:hypothetical protein JYU34_010375 [Plutella xylostella]|uniref:Glycoprotein n=1 Tax=Plutella xylostella TaxID=51655 RepID=A0ABQ7QM03_PLUXY|nr:hypothetical protein JYU34_010375 [Plutella xylostella]